MARPRKDTPPNRFTTAELAVGAGLTARNVSLLEAKGLLPEGEGRAGQGGVMLRDTRGLKWVAVIGAFVAGGVELLLAARLVAAFADDLEAAYGEIPSNLVTAYRKADQTERAALRDRDSDGEWIDIRDDFWMHHVLATCAKSYEPGKALTCDFVFEIVDRQFGFIGTKGLKTLAESGPATETYPALRIIGWDKGGAAQIAWIAEEAGNLSTPEAQRRYTEIEMEYQRARENAVGLLRINASLAIRNALDAIHAHRQGRRA